MTRVVSLIVVFFMAFVLVPIGINSNTAHAQGELVNCQVVTGPPVRVLCTSAGVVVLNQTVNVPTVTLPPVTVTIPPIVGPTRTLTVPGGTSTVTAPGPTNTVTSTETQTINAEPSEAPTETVTEEVETTEAGQTTTERVTISPEPTTQAPDKDLLPDSPSGVAVVAGIGLFLLLGLLILGLWLGYIVGYKDSDRKNANFLRALSDRLLLSRRH